jgi:hypothetical protein
VTGSCHRPPPYSCIKLLLRRRRSSFMQLPSPYARHFMAWLLVCAPRLCSRSEGLPPSLPWPDSSRTFMLSAAPTRLQAFYLCLVHLVSFDSHKKHLMPRPRGRPRRGSPWKPRRPSVSPPDSPSICSSPSLQPEPFISPSPAPPVSQFNCLAIIPRMPSSSSCPLLAPPMVEPAPIPVFDSLRKTGGEPPPPRKPWNSENQSSDSFYGTQLRESLAILYGLVFELRQGVEDLQFRLQATDGKVAVLLQLLSSLQEAFPSDPAGAASVEEPCAATSGGNAKVQRSTENGLEQAKHEDMAVEVDTARRPLQDTSTGADRTASNVEAEVQWADQVTYVEVFF